MDLARFQQESGFKVLAMARLTQCQYSLIFYLLNCSASGLNDVVTNEGELASSIGYSEEEIRDALYSLKKSRMVRCRFPNKIQSEHSSLSVGFEFDKSKWQLDFKDQATHQDAIVYPFHLSGNIKNFKVVQNADEKKLIGSVSDTQNELRETCVRIVRAFVGEHDSEDPECIKMEEEALVLLKAHPVDEILLMARHFQNRVPSLSLLTSSWQHYQEIFQEETEKVDLDEARNKHFYADEALRDRARKLHSNAEKAGLIHTELGVLDILIKHRHPRRQLFWAYQARSRYPNLQKFFHENEELMIAVTTRGIILKKPPF